MIPFIVMYVCLVFIFFGFFHGSISNTHTVKQNFLVSCVWPLFILVAIGVSIARTFND